MKLSSFKEYLSKGIARKITPNIARAHSLIEDAEKRNDFLIQLISNIKLDDNNANYFIEEAYDILIGLIRAKLLQDGFEASGNYSHEAEVSYLAEMEFSDFEKTLMDNLRQFRNGIKYYGKRYSAEDGKKIIDFMKKMLPKLKEKLKASRFGSSPNLRKFNQTDRANFRETD